MKWNSSFRKQQMDRLFDDINVDDNGKITGLPEKMCKIMNSQEANAKYEEIRDNIYMLTDYKNQYGLEDILAFKEGIIFRTLR